MMTPTFIDFRLAIGMLVVAGYPAIWRNHLIQMGDEIVCPVFRDGTTWKVKEQAVQDFIEDHHHLKAH